MELIQFFQDNNKTYLTIQKTVEEKVHGILSDGKMLLKLAVLSLVESIRNNPDKYSSLLYRNAPSSTTEYSGQYYGSCLYEQTYMSYHHDGEGSGAMLIEEAEKLYNKLAKELSDEIISDCASNVASSSLPLLPSSNEGQTHVFPGQTPDNQTKIHKENVHSQLDCDNDLG
jgi:hypothetical protein